MVTGGEPTEQQRFGDHLDHDERYARTDEFLSVVRGAWTQAPFDFDGEHYQVEGAHDPRHASTRCRTSTSAARPAPAGPVAAKHADVYLTWGEPPEQVAEKIAWIRGLAAEQGRDAPVRAAHPHALARHQRAGLAARAVAARRPRPGDHREGAGGAGRQRVGRASSGCGRCTAAARRSRPRTTWRSPRTCGPASAWSAAAPAPRWSAATRRWPTGSRSTTDLGIDEFILSGYPHVEEAYWFGEGVMPVLRAKGIYGPGARERRLVSA